MKESNLWDKLKPELAHFGKFQKISDRFTPGIPDVLGCFVSKGHAWELKELDGVRVVKARFRPGQLDWLEDWDKSGGTSWIVSTWSKHVVAHQWPHGSQLELGMSPEELFETSSIFMTRGRGFSWREFVTNLLNHHQV